MKKTLFVKIFFPAQSLVLLISVIGFVSGAAAQSVEKYKILSVADGFSRSGFDPIGGFVLYGGSSESFQNFNNFTLDQVRDEKTAAGQIKLVGGLTVNLTDDSSRTFQMENISINAKTLTFSTETLNDVRYEFNGIFLKSGSFSRYNGKKVPVLRGTLKKYDSGKLTTEENLRFSFKVWKARYYVPAN